MKHYFIEKEFEHCGLKCVVVFTVMGFRNGYVGVPINHPLYFKDLDAVSLDVHGGLTYSNGGGGSYFPIESDLWWFGFDCGHFDDLNDMESYERYFGDMPDYMKHVERFDRTIKYRQDIATVKTQEHVEAECKRLAEQLAEYANKEKGETK